MPRDNRKPRSRTYAFLVKWIADNDNAGDNEGIEATSGYISVLMVADLCSTTPKQVATDVYALRQGTTPTRLKAPLGAGLPWSV
jgi:hypothetical protein